MSGAAKQYDVVIVGGGPGGAAAGTLLARGGLSVVILDKCRFPRDKPCAGLLSGRGARVVDEIFGDGTVREVTRATSTGCRLYHEGRLAAEADGCERMYFVRRREFDAALIERARDAGCQVLEERRVVAVDRRTAAARSSSGELVRGLVLIGADGANSVVGRAVRPRASQLRRRVGFGLVAEAPLDELKSGELRDACSRMPHIHLGLAPWSYGWIFPCGDRVSLGFGGLRSKGTDFAGCARRLVEQHCRPGAWERLKPRGHLLPLGACERRPGIGNVLLVGDAAGLVEPVTGEGIGFAVASARLAAAAAQEALDAGKPPEAARLYNAAYRRAILPHFRQAALARWLFFPRPCLRRAMGALGRKPQRVRWYLELLAGRITYAQYFWRLFTRQGHREA